jgi:hypothetical protein
MSEELNNENIEEVAKAEEVIAEEPKVEETPVVEPTPVVEEAPAVNVITKDAPEEEVKGLAPVANDAIGSTTVKKTPKPAPVKKEEPAEETVAIFSTKNVSWQGVGKVTRGFNIVSKDAAESWLTRNHVRLVTPEELAGAYGK